MLVAEAAAAALGDQDAGARSVEVGEECFALPFIVRKTSVPTGTGTIRSAPERPDLLDRPPALPVSPWNWRLKRNSMRVESSGVASR